MTADLYLERLRAASRIASDLDGEQQHERAADCLQEAIDTGRPDPATVPDTMRLAIRETVEAVSRERDRQRRREAMLQAYLQQ